MHLYSKPTGIEPVTKPQKPHFPLTPRSMRSQRFSASCPREVEVELALDARRRGLALRAPTMPSRYLLQERKEVFFCIFPFLNRHNLFMFYCYHSGHHDSFRIIIIIFFYFTIFESYHNLFMFYRHYYDHHYSFHIIMIIIFFYFPFFNHAIIFPAFAYTCFVFQPFHFTKRRIERMDSLEEILDYAERDSRRHPGE